MIDFKKSKNDDHSVIVKDIYCKTINTGWIRKLITGSISDDDMMEFIFELGEKCLCDSKGKDLSWDNVPVDDFQIVTEYILNKCTSAVEKKS